MQSTDIMPQKCDLGAFGRYAERIVLLSQREPTLEYLYLCWMDGFSERQTVELLSDGNIPHYDVKMTDSHHKRFQNHLKALKNEFLGGEQTQILVETDPSQA